LKTIRRNIDVIPETVDFATYKIIAAPGLKLVSEKTAKKLELFVENGGILILNKECGIKDTLSRFGSKLPPGLFQEMAGIKIPATSSKSSMSGNLIMGQDNQMKNQTFGLNFPGLKTVFQPLTLIEQIELKGAEALAFVSGSGLEGKPVVTLNKWENGYVVYVGSDYGDIGFYEAWAEILISKFAIQPILNVPKGVDVLSRFKGNKEFIFLLNYTSQPREINYTRRNG